MTTKTDTHQFQGAQQQGTLVAITVAIVYMTFGGPTTGDPTFFEGVSLALRDLNTMASCR